MRKVELKNGMVLKERNGRLLFFIGISLISQYETSLLMNNYNQDLLSTIHKKFDIIEVFDVKDSVFIEDLEDIFDIHNLISIWKRERLLLDFNDVLIPQLKKIEKEQEWKANWKDNIAGQKKFYVSMQRGKAVLNFSTTLRAIGVQYFSKETAQRLVDEINAVSSDEIEWGE